MVSKAFSRFTYRGTSSMLDLETQDTDIDDARLCPSHDSRDDSSSATKSMQNVMSGMSSETRRNRTSTVEEGVWLCEAALWNDWIHVGTVRAQTPCRLVVVHVSKFLDASRRHARMHKLTKEYGT